MKNTNGKKRQSNTNKFLFPRLRTGWRSAAHHQEKKKKKKRATNKKWIESHDRFLMINNIERRIKAT